MALPKIDVPTYELTLPSEDKVVQYRPFLVKEEKLLMIAMESGEDKQVQQAVLDLVNSLSSCAPISSPSSIEDTGSHLVCSFFISFIIIYFFAFF